MPISGVKAIRILEKNGFKLARQKGSHVVMVKVRSESKTIAVIPKHKELKKGTLRSIARQSGISKSEFGL